MDTTPPWVIQGDPPGPALAELARHAFFEHVLPALRTELPELVHRIIVTVGSSVAYGLADRHSDLDCFIIFIFGRDYALYAARVDRLIRSLPFPRWYSTVCDKGVRFELESLARSDISRIYRHPGNATSWLRQTDWLMHWFGRGLVIYDPTNVMRRFNEACGAYPADVAGVKCRRAMIKARILYSRLSRDRVNKHGSLVWLGRVWRVLNAALDMSYWSAREFSPHPKWKYTLAQSRPVGILQRSIVSDVANVLDGIEMEDRPKVVAYVNRIVERMASEPYPVPPATRIRPADLVDLRCPTPTWLLTEGRVDPQRLNEVSTAVSRGQEVFLAEDLGSPFWNHQRPSYDSALRVSDIARHLAHRHGARIPVPPETSSIVRRRWIYLHFIIWRKIRVIGKAVQRGQRLNVLGYTFQVVAHLLEAASRLRGGFLAPDADWPKTCAGDPTIGDVLGPDLDAFLLRPTLTSELLASPGALVDALWRMHRNVQRELVRCSLLSERWARDPLSSQFIAQYWKYENLFY